MNGQRVTMQIAAAETDRTPLSASDWLCDPIDFLRVIVASIDKPCGVQMPQLPIDWAA